MKRLLMLLMLFTLTTLATKAQNLIAVQNGKAPKFYAKLPDAVTNAMAGDTLYIPGGKFDDVTINKKLYLIGVGNDPDSTKVTSRTFISNVQLIKGADNGMITGIYCSDILGSGSISGYTIARCYVGTVEQSGGTLTANNFTIYNNFIGSLYLDNGTNNSLLNNIINYNISIINSSIQNNIFLYTPRYAGDTYDMTATNCLIENNIVEQYGWGGNVASNSTFHNNVNGGDNGIDATGNQGSGNFETIIPLKSIFLNYNPAVLGTDDIYKSNFNLRSNSLYKNAGKDGTDIGIYGGAFPWKPGSIPFNPHFQSLSIAPKTDASGNLKVQITVAAQNN